MRVLIFNKLLIRAFPSLRSGRCLPGFYPQLMLRFTCYKGTFSTFVFASQNRSFILMASPPPTAALQAANAGRLPMLLVMFFMGVLTSASAQGNSGVWFTEFSSYLKVFLSNTAEEMVVSQTLYKGHEVGAPLLQTSIIKRVVVGKHSNMYTENRLVVKSDSISVTVDSLSHQVIFNVESKALKTPTEVFLDSLAAHKDDWFTQGKVEQQGSEVCFTLECSEMMPYNKIVYYFDRQSKALNRQIFYSRIEQTVLENDRPVPFLPKQEVRYTYHKVAQTPLFKVSDFVKQNGAVWELNSIHKEQSFTLFDYQKYSSEVLKEAQQAGFK
jgi:hypothetical protein